MIREVDLVSYLPSFLAEFKETAVALKAANPEFVHLWKAFDRALYNEFIEMADEYGISRFEKILGIYPYSTDTLEVRRIRVQNRWLNKIPYTIRNLSEKISKILGNEYNFDIQADFENLYNLHLIIYTLNDSWNEELEYTLSKVVPTNIITNIVYEGIFAGQIFCGGKICESDIIEIRQRQV